MHTALQRSLRTSMVCHCKFWFNRHYTIHICRSVPAMLFILYWFMIQGSIQKPPHACEYSTYSTTDEPLCERTVK